MRIRRCDPWDTERLRELRRTLVRARVAHASVVDLHEVDRMRQPRLLVPPDEPDADGGASGIERVRQ